VSRKCPRKRITSRRALPRFSSRPFPVIGAHPFRAACPSKASPVACAWVTNGQISAGFITGLPNRRPPGRATFAILVAAPGNWVLNLIKAGALSCFRSR